MTLVTIVGNDCHNHGGSPAQSATTASQRLPVATGPTPADSTEAPRHRQSIDGLLADLTSHPGPSRPWSTRPSIRAPRAANAIWAIAAAGRVQPLLPQARIRHRAGRRDRPHPRALRSGNPAPGGDAAALVPTQSLMMTVAQIDTSLDRARPPPHRQWGNSLNGGSAELLIASRPGEGHDRGVESPVICGVLPPALAAAIEEMCQDLERYGERNALRRRLDRCVTGVEGLVRELEPLADRGERLPSDLRARLDALAGELPAPLGAGLAASEPADLVPRLVQVEEELFSRILGDLARALRARG